MSAQHPPPYGPRSSPLFSTLAGFLVGAVLGSLAMVQIVPASHVVAGGELNGQQGVIDPENSDTPGVGLPGEEDSGPDGPAPGPGDPRGGGSAAGPVNPGDPDPGNPGDPGEPGDPGDPGGNRNTRQGIECAPGRNGGETDQGVTADSIRMATTVVESGVGSSFLGEVRHAMQAVVNRVNRDGGICGRRLEVVYRDDAWNPSTGAQFLRNFINQGIFAVPVGPSSEGLNLVIESGDFDKAQIPVVGTNGLIIKQYERADGKAQEWVFPVAAATVSSARIMAKDAFDRMVKAGENKGENEIESSDFSVVFAHNYRFGEEGAEAFNAEVKRLTGGDIPGYEEESTSCRKSYCALAAGDGSKSYSQHVTNFEPGKFVAFFLEPQTAGAWMRDNNAKRANHPDIPFGFGAAQPLFTKGFAEDCHNKCHGMLVWTGFKPFQEHYRSDPDVQSYVNDLRTTNRNADVNNQFSMGAYVGMELLVEGLRAVGPELTRVKLKRVLDGITFDSGLTLADPMQFSPDNRYVATRMQAWEIQHINSFSGWSSQQIVADPRFGG